MWMGTPKPRQAAAHGESMVNCLGAVQLDIDSIGLPMCHVSSGRHVCCGSRKYRSPSAREGLVAALHLCFNRPETRFIFIGGLFPFFSSHFLYFPCLHFGVTIMPEDKGSRKRKQATTDDAKPKKTRIDSGEYKPQSIKPHHKKNRDHRSDDPSDKFKSRSGPRRKEISAQAALPIWAGRNTILSAVAHNPTVVLVGETGSGKTTQVPQFLFSARKDLGLTSATSPLIAITQPRRVAAVTLSRRVAQEMHCTDPLMLPRKSGSHHTPDHDADAKAWAVEPNQEGKDSGRTRSAALVGYSIRFDDRTGPDTRIRFMTDGFLLREMLGSSLTRLARQHRPVPGTSAGNSHLAKPKGQGQVTLAPSDLKRYGIIIIDEAHERTLDTDLLLGLAKTIQADRYRRAAAWDEALPSKRQGPRPQELRIVVMSATLDAGKFVDFFSTPLTLPPSFNPPGKKNKGEKREGQSQVATKPASVPVLYVRGRQHGVTRFHTLEPCADWRDAALRAVCQIHTSYPAGDILVFMTGQEDIEAMASQLRTYGPGLEKAAMHQSEGASEDEHIRPAKLDPVPLYAALGPKGAANAFRPAAKGTRKVILATNIAEASVTLPGIRYVVDSGLAKVARWTSSSKSDASGLEGSIGSSTEILAVEPISRSSATQRAGRAGREAPGTCFHLYTSESAKTLPSTTEPAAAHAELSGSLLRLAAVGVAPDNFPWLDPPTTERLAETVMRLAQLGALRISPAVGQSASEPDNSKNQAPTLTPLGARMALLPLEPSLARVVLAAEPFGPIVTRQARDLVAVLSGERGLFLDPRQRQRDRAQKKAAARGLGASDQNAVEDEDSDDEAVSSNPFAHPSGDHATSLEALYAYLRMRVQSRAAKLGAADIRTWCTNHGIDHRSAAEAARTRIQLKRVCKQQHIECDDLRSASEETDLNFDDPGNEEAPQDDEGDLSSSGSDEELETDRTSSTQLKKGLPTLRVSKGGGGADAGLQHGRQEAYTDLRRALVSARMGQYAIKSPEGSGASGYRRGDEVVKIHPSSVLHSKRPAVVVFEEAVLTSQVFVRTVSAVEPAWLAEAYRSTQS